MSFFKELAIAFIAFALFGALAAAGILSPRIARIPQDSFGMAVIIYSGVLFWSGWNTHRTLSVRMFALTAVWFFQAVSITLNSEGLLLLTALVASIAAARYILTTSSANSMPEQPKL